MDETIEITDLKKICKTLENFILEKPDPTAKEYEPEQYDEIFIELFVHNSISNN